MQKGERHVFPSSCTLMVPEEDDNLPLLVLPPDTVLKDGYRLNYLSSGGMSITYTAIRGDEKYLVKEVEAGDPKKVIAP